MLFDLREVWLGQELSWVDGKMRGTKGTKRTKGLRELRD